MFEDVSSIFIWAQIAGLLAMSITICAMQLKKSRSIILSSVPSGLLWATQYMLLGAAMGAIMNAASAIKNLLAVYLPEKYIAYLLGLHIIMIWIIGLTQLNAWYALFPIIGASCGSIAIIINRDNRALYVRAVVLGCSMWAIYNFTVGAYMGLACDTMTIISSLIGMSRHENWDIGKCYKSFFPSISRALFSFNTPRTYP